MGWAPVGAASRQSEPSRMERAWPCALRGFGAKERTSFALSAGGRFLAAASISENDFMGKPYPCCDKRARLFHGDGDTGRAQGHLILKSPVTKGWRTVVAASRRNVTLRRDAATTFSRGPALEFRHFQNEVALRASNSPIAGFPGGCQIPGFAGWRGKIERAAQSGPPFGIADSGSWLYWRRSGSALRAAVGFRAVAGWEFVEEEAGAGGDVAGAAGGVLAAGVFEAGGVLGDEAVVIEVVGGESWSRSLLSVSRESISDHPSRSF